MTEEADWRAPSGTVVLDIGDDVGALIVYCPPGWLGTEIEVDHLESPGSRAHTGVRERTAGGRRFSAAVFPGLIAGRYQVFDPAGIALSEATVVGGEVTEIDMATSSPGADDYPRADAAVASSQHHHSHTWVCQLKVAWVGKGCRDRDRAWRWDRRPGAYP